jgi:hypothetical protein
MKLCRKIRIWFKRTFKQKGWLRGWRVQDYVSEGYNGEIVQNKDRSITFFPDTHDDVTDYRARKCEIAKRVNRPKKLKFAFTLTGFSKEVGSYTIIQQFVEKILAPICYLVVVRKENGLELQMTNKVPDSSSRGYSIPVFHSFDISENKRVEVSAEYSRDGFKVDVDGETSGWIATPFTEYDKTWVKLGLYGWDSPLKEDLKITIHSAKIR